MAGRRPKAPEDRRDVVARIRLTRAEQRAIQQRAVEAGVTFADYVRETAMGRKPRAKPAKAKAIEDVFYELGRIANNLAQLEAATGDETYRPWAVYVGKEMVERLTDRADLAPVLMHHVEAVNGIGHLINSLARRANSGKDIDDAERDEALTILKDVLAPIHKAVAKGPKGRELDGKPDGPEGSDAL